ncbi:MAG: hotdog fold thioesterase [Chitinophagaceae bacterium]|nr:hotdog fold thioesterase [Chitinophagaceae bacterium]
MSIWFKTEITLEQLQETGRGTMDEHIGIEWIEIGRDYLKARMPVDQRTRQAYGLLHGGASCVLAESIGSIASAMVIDPAQYQCVGLEINANHVHSATAGHVTAVAMPLHLGKSTHVWDIRIYNDHEKLVCVSRLTVAIIPKRDFSKPRSL